MNINNISNEEKIFLITGGTGTWGQELTRQLLITDPKEIRIFSRSENTQVAMRQKFNDSRLKFIIGDVRDFNSLKEACRDVKIVFHAAALKHVDKCEKQPREAVRTNIEGAQNVILAAAENNVYSCVNISTDKVCCPESFYGMTKGVAERLFVEANNLTLDTDYFNFRSGNIFGSAGSVIPIWIEQLENNNCITLTDSMMTRFFITVKDAVCQILKALTYSDRAETFVPFMPSINMYDLAKEIIYLFGNKNSVIKIIGKRPGENLHEVLITDNEKPLTVVYKRMYIIYPKIPIETVNVSIPDDSFETFFSSAENQYLLTGKKLRNYIKKIFSEQKYKT